MLLTHFCAAASCVKHMVGGWYVCKRVRRPDRVRGVLLGAAAVAAAGFKYCAQPPQTTSAMMVDICIVYAHGSRLEIAAQMTLVVLWWLHVFRLCMPSVIV